eukprot:COSAG01_NODE_41330_length_453_cov_0.548023_1_plen_100_part_01
MKRFRAEVADVCSHIMMVVGRWEQLTCSRDGEQPGRACHVLVPLRRLRGERTLGSRPAQPATLERTRACESRGARVGGEDSQIVVLASLDVSHGLVSVVG